MSKLPDKRQVRRAFEQAAEGYDASAVLQREVADRLLQRLDYIRMEPGTILDLGTGTGYCSHHLARRYPKARIVALDLAHSMVRSARGRFSRWQRMRRRHGFICADAEHLPLADDSVEMIFSSLTLQWCGDLEHTFAEFARVLKPGGLLMFATLGPDTLRELRAAWAGVDGGAHVNEFIDMHDVGDALVRARLAGPVLDMEHITMTYQEGMGLLRDIKGIGAHTVGGSNGRGLTGKGKLRMMLEQYERFRGNDNRLPATYEVVYGHAWAPDAATAPAKLPAGEVPVTFDLMKGAKK